MAAPPMCVTGKQIGYTSSGVGRIRVTNAYMLAITDVSECHAPFGSDVEPDVWYSQRRTRSGSGAAGSEAGSPVGSVAHKLVGLLPDAVASPLMRTAGIDRLNALYSAIDMVRRGGTISLSGVYGGAADPMPMFQLFDKQVQLRMGQGNVHRWVPEILPLLTDADPLGVDDFATHRLPLSAAPEAYATFQKKQDGMVKVLLQPQQG